MKSGKRFVFAAGLDGSKMLFFISGNEASIDFGSGFQLESPSEPANGKFDKLEKVKKLAEYSQAKFSAEELVFAVKDSKGAELVGMSKQGVNVLSLSSGSFDHLEITNDDLITFCYRHGALHISSSDAGTYYILDSKGYLGKVSFSNTDSVALSKSCLEDSLGNLCYQGKKMTLSRTCKDPPPKSIVSGLVTSGSAYLFTKAGDLYLFSASLFKQSSGSVDVTVVKAEEAWPTGGAGGGSSHRPPNGSHLFSLFSTLVSSFILSLFSPNRKQHLGKLGHRWPATGRHPRRRFRRHPRPGGRHRRLLLLQTKRQTKEEGGGAERQGQKDEEKEPEEEEEADHQSEQKSKDQHQQEQSRRPRFFAQKRFSQGLFFKIGRRRQLFFKSVISTAAAAN